MAALLVRLRGATPPAAAWHWEGHPRIAEFGGSSQAACGRNRKRGKRHATSPAPEGSDQALFL
eukprot:276716-Prymnesium_polylepis.1